MVLAMASLPQPWTRTAAATGCGPSASTSYPVAPCHRSFRRAPLQRAIKSVDSTTGSQRRGVVRTATATPAATAQHEVQGVPATASHEAQLQGSAQGDDACSSAQLESLSALEWPAVCRQVACFCNTVMATQLAASAQLPIGRSREESEQLLQQTAEALQANINLKGVFDLRPALDAAASGLCLSARQLEGVANTLQVAFAAKDAACAQLPGNAGFCYPALAAIAAGITDTERDTMQTILKCVKGGYVTDGASDELQAVREQRIANKAALRAAINEQAKMVFSKGASDSPNNEIVIRGRYCIGIKAGRSGDLPKGSTKVGQSQSGATHYYEPAPVIQLNNLETLLEERQQREEMAVLGFLSQLIAKRVPQLSRLLAATAALDIVAARAAHARWLKGVRPRFGSWQQVRAAQQSTWQGRAPPPPLPPQPAEPSSVQTSIMRDSGGAGSEAHAAAQLPASAMHVPLALHPLLLEPSLPPLPEPPSIDDNSFESEFQERGAWEVRRSLVARADDAPVLSASRRPAPRALDLRVPPAAAVVAITGPNTGGKTITLKTAGLAALMAKAGLFLAVGSEVPLPGQPTAATNGAATAASASAAAGQAAAGPAQEAEAPVVLWFDQVLADIGDTQSLQQNLSTFSGHVRRIRGILGAATAQSLVLLDEVGSGTDPQEGAALARAVLDRLAGSAGLTLATTHHAELKTVATEDPRYANVSMEFDVASLAPTYRLCWGTAGASNALDIARALGFDSDVVRDARSVARATAARQVDAATHMAAVAESLQAQLQEARADLEALRRRREAADAYIQELHDEMRQLADTRVAIEESPRKIVKEVKTFAAELQAAVDAYGEGKMTAEDLAKEFAVLEANMPDLIARAKGLQHESDPAKDDVVWVERLSREAVVMRVVGDSVYVKPLMLRNTGAANTDIVGMATVFSPSKGLKYKKEDVRVLVRAADRSDADVPESYRL